MSEQNGVAKSVDFWVRVGNQPLLGTHRVALGASPALSKSCFHICKAGVREGKKLFLYPLKFRDGDLRIKWAKDRIPGGQVLLSMHRGASQKRSENLKRQLELELTI